MQRVDVHPLDEAQGYAALIELQPDTYIVESIAARVWQIASIRERATTLDSTHSRSEASVL